MRRVLIVDDAPDVGVILSKLLRKVDYEPPTSTQASSRLLGVLIARDYRPAACALCGQSGAYLFGAAVARKFETMRATSDAAE